MCVYWLMFVLIIENIMQVKQVPGYSAYTITEDGKTITNTITGRVLKLHPQRNTKGVPSGYLYTSLMPDNAYKRVFQGVHRVVALTFLGPPPIGKPWVNHKDGNKANNHVSNLEWTSISENIQHAHDTGLRVVPKGSAHWRYGKEVSKETRAKMSKLKQGVKHPKFCGYYVVDGVKYPSARVAAEVLKICSRTVHVRCKNKPNKWGNFYFEPLYKK